MRIRNDPNSLDKLKKFDKFIANTDFDFFKELVNNNKDKKIYLEIGMGKGKFLTSIASYDNDNIYIGIELSDTILSIAVKNILKVKEEKNDNDFLNNMYVTNINANSLLKYFNENTIDGIYLNFSDPWPKKRHEKRRLTYIDFLKIYKSLLKKDGFIQLKTDNKLLFEYSIYSMNNFGMLFEKVFVDLHSTNELNFVTEYEEKKSQLGPIYKLCTRFK